MSVGGTGVDGKGGNAPLKERQGKLPALGREDVGPIKLSTRQRVDVAELGSGKMKRAKSAMDDL